MGMDVPMDEGVHMPRSLLQQIRPSFGEVVFHRESAYNLLLRALRPDGRVDFPTVTEICEGVAINTSEMGAVAELLSTALQREACEDGAFSLQVKALTVAHELLYNADACQILACTPGFFAAVKRLHTKHLRDAQVPHRAGLRAGGPAEECVRLFASEIYRTLGPSYCSYRL